MKNSKDTRNIVRALVKEYLNDPDLRSEVEELNSKFNSESAATDKIVEIVMYQFDQREGSNMMDAYYPQIMTMVIAGVMQTYKIFNNEGDK